MSHIIDKLISSFPSCYNIDYLDFNSRNIVISFSPTSRFFLYKEYLECKKICIASKENNYYLYNPGKSAKLLANAILNLDIDNVLIIGSSKAGFASILWGALLTKILSNKVNVFTLAFSPQTSLYPLNNNLEFPSYKKFISSLETKPDLLKCAITYGHLPSILDSYSSNILIIYPNKNICDKNEALALKNIKNVVLREIDSFIHGSIFPFLIDTQDNIQVCNMVNKLFLNAEKDDDLRKTLPSSKEDLSFMIKNITAPKLKELIDAIFLQMAYEKELNNYNKVKELGFL